MRVFWLKSNYELDKWEIAGVQLEQTDNTETWIDLVHSSKKCVTLSSYAAAEYCRAAMIANPRLEHPLLVLTEPPETAAAAEGGGKGHLPYVTAHVQDFLAIVSEATMQVVTLATGEGTGRNVNLPEDATPGNPKTGTPLICWIGSHYMLDGYRTPSGHLIYSMNDADEWINFIRQNRSVTITSLTFFEIVKSAFLADPRLKHPVVVCTEPTQKEQAMQTDLSGAPFVTMHVSGFSDAMRAVEDTSTKMLDQSWSPKIAQQSWDAKKNHPELWACNPEQLKVLQNETLTCLDDRSNSEWSWVRDPSLKEGWVPASILASSQADPAAQFAGQIIAQVQHNYNAIDGNGEPMLEALPLPAGGWVVIRDMNNDWYYGNLITAEGTLGWFPKGFVRLSSVDELPSAYGGRGP